MKKTIREICVISAAYPTASSPKYTFVDQLVSAWADMGIKCTVISPNNALNSIFNKNDKKPRMWSKKTAKGNKINIYSPSYISLSRKRIMGFNSIEITINNFKKAVFREIKRLNLKPDALYSHFIVPTGIATADIGKKLNIPTFIAVGESSLDYLKEIGLEKISKKLSNINGIVSVSTENKRRLLKYELIGEEKIEVFPNAIDSKYFYQRDKRKMREKFGYKKDDFIVAFTGHFIHRKGSSRLSKALESLPEVKSIFIGDGPEKPTCKNILHMGKVAHENIAELLSTADIFVLPTLNEGCCNAIIEAMSCGLPIVSSDRPFNDDILWDDNSIKIDPMDIEEIKNAIKYLKDNDMIRQKMSSASLIHASKFKIEDRAKNIFNFMKRKITS